MHIRHCVSYMCLHYKSPVLCSRDQLNLFWCDPGWRVVTTEVALLSLHFCSATPQTMGEKHPLAVAIYTLLLPGLLCRQIELTLDKKQ